MKQLVRDLFAWVKMSISICDVLFIMSLFIDVNAPNLRTPSTMDIVLTPQSCNGRTQLQPINTSGPAYTEQQESIPVGCVPPAFLVSEGGGQTPPMQTLIQADPPVNRHTSVKTLACPKLHLRAVIIGPNVLIVTKHPNHADEEARKRALKPRADVIRSPNQGVPVACKRTNVLQNFFKKPILFLILLSIRRAWWSLPEADWVLAVTGFRASSQSF